ncbi:MAG TPA: ATP-dependent DNA helicase [Frankiaceae bacterium]|nr:ATP-dependent DNA helicase [Frankiaceae bacterium]
MTATLHTVGLAYVPEPSGAYLRALLRIPFTDEQLAVASAPLDPLLVVAGAGSGKTAVMAARVVHLVAHHRLAASDVLGLTFTNKAAVELSDRVRKALLVLARAGVVDETLLDDLPTVATYHSYAAAVVRDHALRVGREPMSELLTEATRWQVAGRVVRRAAGPFRHLRWQPAYVTRLVLALDAEMSEHLVSADEVRAFDAALAAEADGLAKQTNKTRECGDTARARDELLALVEAYRAEKRAKDLLDFGDQVALAAEIAAASEEVCALERDRFQAVLLDEYQDTGVAQRRLLQALFGGGHPVTAVGDPNQGIYGWRGASVGNLARFPEHFPDAQGRPATVLPLMTSFRCAGRILDVANAIARPLATSAPAQRRPVVDIPELTPCAGSEHAGEVRAALLETVEAEAAWVAEGIAAAVADGTPPKECAVLSRRRTDFGALHRALVARGLPVEVVGLGGLLEMPEVSDVVAYLRVLVDPAANPALVRILTGPRWRLGSRDLYVLGRRARHLAAPAKAGAEDTGPDAVLRAAAVGVDPVDVVSLADALDSLGVPDRYSAEAYDRLRALRDELCSLRPFLGQPVVDVVAEIVRRIGLDVEIEAEPDAVAAARAANLDAFLDHAAHFTGIDGTSDPRAFLAYLDAAADAENGLDAGGVSGADTVKLLTVHKAKGLEWDVVAVPGLTAGVFPSSQGRPRWTQRAEVLPYALRGDRDDLPPFGELTTKALDEFKADCAAESDDEERRLGYVAFTRARSTLLLSGYWWGASQVRTKGASPLLQEVLALDGLVTADELAPEPEPGSANPLLAARGVDVPWPPPYDPERYARRSAAAALVTCAAAAPVTPADPETQRRDDEWRAEADLLLAELRRTASAHRDVLLPARLTASQLVLLAEDPDELARRLARPLPQRPAARARRGTRFHAWVEELYGDRPLLDPGDLPGAADPDVTDTELADLQQRFLASPYGTRRPVAIEAPFELVAGGRVVRGRIDAVYEDDDGTYDVIDFKTGALPRDFAAASLQLTVYRLAWAGIQGVDPARVRAGFLYVRTGEVKRPDRLLSTAEVAALLSEPAVGAQTALF